MSELKNIKHEAFCMEYARSANAAESYKAAGYKCKSDNAAGAAAHRLLRNADIKARLQEIAAEIAMERIASVAEIQERLTAILRGETLEEQVVVEGCGDGVSEARVMQRKPLLKDMIKAGETLGKMQGAFDGKMKLEMMIPVFGGEGNLED